MQKKIKIFGTAVLLACSILLTACGSKGDEASTANAETEAEEGSKAPDFTVELNDGNSFTLSEHEGEVILLNFWATWCSPCVEEMPAFEKLYKEYGDKLQIVAVNSGENKKTVDRFVSEKNYTFPIAYNENNELNQIYPSDGIPYTLVIGKDGTIKETFVGAADADTQYKTYRRAVKEAFESE